MGSKYGDRGLSILIDVARPKNRVAPDMTVVSSSVVVAIIASKIRARADIAMIYLPHQHLVVRVMATGQGLDRLFHVLGPQSGSRKRMQINKRKRY